MPGPAIHIALAPTVLGCATTLVISWLSFRLLFEKRQGAENAGTSVAESLRPMGGWWKPTTGATFETYPAAVATIFIQAPALLFAILSRLAGDSFSFGAILTVLPCFAWALSAVVRASKR